MVVVGGWVGGWVVRGGQGVGAVMAMAVIVVCIGTKEESGDEGVFEWAN